MSSQATTHAVSGAPRPRPRRWGSRRNRAGAGKAACFELHHDPEPDDVASYHRPSAGLNLARTGPERGAFFALSRQRRPAGQIDDSLQFLRGDRQLSSFTRRFREKFRRPAAVVAATRRVGKVTDYVSGDDAATCTLNDSAVTHSTATNH